MGNTLYRLTPAQRALLERLPDAPSDGRGLAGAALRVANNLKDRGLVRSVGRSFYRTYYVRTDAGAAALAEVNDKRKVPPNG
jgi:hypothetical protein